ncbi:Unknown protein, partial [Striga hermonthica]
DVDGEVVDQVEYEEPLFVDEITDEETNAEYTMARSGDWCKTCAWQRRTQLIEVKESEEAKVKETIWVMGDGGHDEMHAPYNAHEEMFVVEVLVQVDEDHERDVHVIEEEVPENWMVEDESLRTRTFSKGAGMIRKWVPDPDDKKIQEARRPDEAGKRAKTTHAWPKRRVRARMRGNRAHEKRRVQGNRQGRAHAQWRRRAWRLEIRRSGAQGEVVRWIAREGDCYGPMNGCASTCGWAGTSQRRASGLDARERTSEREGACEGWSDTRTAGVCAGGSNALGAAHGRIACAISAARETSARVAARHEEYVQSATAREWKAHT